MSCDHETCLVTTGNKKNNKGGEDENNDDNDDSDETATARSRDATGARPRRLAGAL